MHLSFFEKDQRRHGRRANVTSAVAAVLHLTLICLSCLQSSAFRVSSISQQYTRAVEASQFCEILPEVHLIDNTRNVAPMRIISPHRHLHRPLTMSSKSDDIGAEQLSATGAVSPNETMSSSGTSEGSSSSVVSSSLSRTLLVAIPLMMKFVLVLIIKFLTDLVVFPLLLTYRAARLGKRRVVKIWKQWTSRSGKTRESGSANDVDVEVYKPNGSAP